MGVNTFVLDRRAVMLSVGGSVQAIGTLRRFFKLTELSEERTSDLAAAAAIAPSPPAVLVPDITELSLAKAPEEPQQAHLVLGWDEGRGHVTDFGWDYLPVLGYAIRDRASGHYTLYEEVGGVLHELDAARVLELRLVGSDGQLVRRGQPRIVACKVVRPYIPGYAEADCNFENGREETLLVMLEANSLPPETWFVGKQPMDVRCYRGDH